MGERATLTLNPAVVRWSLETRGWDAKELAEKSGVPEPVIRKIQSEESPIDIVNLKRISKCMGQPLAVFLLSKPPDEPELINYGGMQEKRLSRKTLDAIRTSRYWQSVSREILEAQSESLKPDAKEYSVESDPESAALDERQRLGFGPDGAMSATKTDRESYNALRDGIESLNIFVYHLEMGGGDACGISMAGKHPAVITVNPSGSYKQRTFALLHEYAHILLRTNGYCMSSPELPRDTCGESNGIEAWCNAFAGSVLMPRRELLTVASLLEEESKDAGYMAGKMSDFFGASRQAVAARMMMINRESSPSPPCWECLEKPKNRRTNEPKYQTTPYGMCLDKRGKKFTSMILISHARDTITHADVIEYLELDPEHFPKLRKALCKNAQYAGDWHKHSDHLAKLWSLEW